MKRVRSRLVAPMAILVATSMLSTGTADARIETYKRVSRLFASVELRTRGFLNDDCLGGTSADQTGVLTAVGDGATGLPLDYPCLTNAGFYRPEATAQARALQELSGPAPFAPRAVSPAVEDRVQWEVAPRASVCPDTEDPADTRDDDNPTTKPVSGPCWRVDVVRDRGAVQGLFEVKRWVGESTRTDVDAQINSYAGRMPLYDPKLVAQRDGRLDSYKWSKSYVSLGIDGTGSRFVFVSCVWADARDTDGVDRPGNIYFAPLPEVPEAVKATTPGCSDEAEMEAQAAYEGAEEQESASNSWKRPLLAAITALSVWTALELGKRPPEDNVPPDDDDEDIDIPMPAPTISPSYQDADYWTCQATYRVTVAKNPYGPTTLRMQWGDQSPDGYFPIPMSTGPSDTVAVLTVSHVFNPSLGASWYQSASIVGQSHSVTGYSTSITTHNASQYDTGISGNYPLIYPPYQSTSANTQVQWTVAAQRNPDRDRYVVFRPNGSSNLEKLQFVPKGIGPVVVGFNHAFSGTGCPSPDGCYTTKIQHVYYADTYTEVVPYTEPPYHVRNYSVVQCSNCGPYD